MAHNDTLALLVAGYYVGLFVFAVNGLVWLAHRNEVQRHARAMERAQRVLFTRVRRRK